MKIVRIIARLNVGGPARHVVWLTDALKDDEFRSTLIAGTVPDGEKDMGYFADEHGVEPVYLREMSRELSVRDVTAVFKIYRLLKAERPDIVHTHTAKAGTVGRVAAMLYRWSTRRGVKVVHTFHGHIFHSYYGRAKTSIFLVIERMLARVTTDRIVVLSVQQLEEINSKFRVGRREQFRIIPLGIDVTPFEAAGTTRQRIRAELGASDDTVIVGFIGRLTEIKNLGLLLNVAAKCADDPTVRFVIIGDGHLHADLEQETRGLGIENRVTFLGNRTDVADMYAALDVVALTSLNEGTPLSAIEGMAAGKPVISTAVGGVPGLLGEAIEKCEGFTICKRGIRVETFETEDYLKGLNYLLKNERLRSEMGADAAGYIRSRFSKERLIADIKELYRELYSSKA
jgi:glycosyltransferase involved in cell wall biosynthesis